MNGNFGNKTKHGVVLKNNYSCAIVSGTAMLFSSDRVMRSVFQRVSAVSAYFRALLPFSYVDGEYLQETIGIQRY